MQPSLIPRLRSQVLFLGHVKTFINNYTHTHMHIHTYMYILRAKIEKDYGESLIRLAKIASGKDEIG